MAKNFDHRLLAILSQMDNHFEKMNYSSYDLCDIKALPAILKYYNTFYKKSYGKYFLFPLEIILNKFPGLIRSLTGIRKQAFAQSHALIIRGKLSLSKYLKKESYSNKAEEMMQWILKQKSGETKYSSWGQPYDWFSKDIIPAHTPRTTVSSQMIHAICDICLINNNKDDFNLLKDLSKFFLFEMPRSVDNIDEICFSYTLIDRYKVHNSNMMAASALFRAGTILKDKEILELGEKCLNYTLRRQNKDGSWYYYELESDKVSKIDNYHTGYILEALAVIKNIKGSEFSFDKEFDLGIDFFLNNFFVDQAIPKMTPASVYPIDIQSCAQSIITLMALSAYRKELVEQAGKVLAFTIDKFYNEGGWFSYRINKHGQARKISYIRWGDAWMYLAIVRYLTNVGDA